MGFIRSVLVRIKPTVGNCLLLLLTEGKSKVSLEQTGKTIYDIELTANVLAFSSLTIFRDFNP